MKFESPKHNEHFSAVVETCLVIRLCDECKQYFFRKWNTHDDSTEWTKSKTAQLPKKKKILIDKAENEICMAHNIWLI